MRNTSYVNRRSVRLLIASLLLVLSAPLSLMAAVDGSDSDGNDWSYPTSKPSKPYAGGDGRRDSPYLISTPQQLANFAYMVTTEGESYNGKYFKLTADIKLNENVVKSGVIKEADGSVRYNKNKAHFDALKEWQPIGRYGYIYDDDFKGNFDGGGHIIWGVYVREPKLGGDKSYRHKGLFGNCKGAYIHNLKLSDCFYSICAPNSDEFTTKTGALVGLAKNSAVTDCYAYDCVISCDGDVTLDQWSVGGLVGEAEGSFVCYVSEFNGIVDVYPEATCERTINTKRTCVGGIVGFINNTEFSVEYCKTSGKLMFGQKKSGGDDAVYAGGIIGGDDYYDLKKQHVACCVNRMDIRLFDKNCLNGKLRAGHAHGIVSGTAECVDCINFGNICFGGDEYIDNKTYKARYIIVGGICQKGNVKCCINYGNFSLPTMEYANGANISPWVNDNNTADMCFALNKITYKFNNGEPTLKISQENDSQEDANAYYVEVYETGDDNLKETVSNVEKSIFTDDNYPYRLNPRNNPQKQFGQIVDENDPFYGYLGLVCLGASVKTLNGHGTEADPYLIYTLADLRTVYDIFDSSEKTKGLVFKLANDIDMTNDWTWSNTYTNTIGSEEHPFDGVFDGAGHSIRGVYFTKVSMFRVVTGTVKDLALDNIRMERYKTTVACLAYQVGDYIHKARIERCTVTGDIKIIESVNNSSEFCFGGICCNLLWNATITDCCYVGKVKISCGRFDDSTLVCTVGGIAARSDGTIENCYSMLKQKYHIEDNRENKNLTVNFGGIAAEKQENAKFSNNYYYIGEIEKELKPTAGKGEFAGNVELNESTFSEGTTALDEENVEASRLGDAWVDGLYHPVVKSDYHYACKDYNGNDVALDQYVRTPTDNDILTLVPTASQRSDSKMWQLPNVAVYSDEYDTEVLTNFSIIPDDGQTSHPLRYKPSKSGVGVSGVATYPWAVKPKAVNWRTFCLPGSVSLADLPEGCKLYVGGRVVKDADDTKCKMNIVEVETVPPGVPFLLRYDNQTDDEVVNISMKGELAMTPRKADESSSLLGTFSRELGTYAYSEVVEETADGVTKWCLKKKAGYDGFSAYIADAGTGDIELVDYLLLDEQSNETDDVIDADKDKTLNVKLRRAMKTGGWNTLCLPFDVSGEETAALFGSGTRIEQLTSIGYDDATNAIVMNFGTALSVEAGKPYLVYPGSEGSIFDLPGRTIVGDTSPQTFNVTLGDGSPACISMVGSFGKAYLASTDEENHYFLQADKFYRATSANPVVMSGFRCWFKVTDASGQKAQALNAARVVHADGTVTAIRLVDTGLGTDATRIYDIQGIRHDEMQRGLNIVGGKKIMK